MTLIHCAISQIPELVIARGSIATDAIPSVEVMPESTGVVWSCDLPPGDYIFICDCRAKAGAALTATVIEETSHLPLGSDAETADGDSGTVPSVKLTAHFSVH